MADKNISSGGTLLDRLQLQADKATPEQIKQVASTTFRNDPEALALLNKTLMARTGSPLEGMSGVSNIVDSFVSKNVSGNSGLVQGNRSIDTDINVPIVDTISTINRQNVQAPVTPPAQAVSAGLVPQQAQQVQPVGQTQTEFNSILEFIRGGSEAQKAEIASQIRSSLQANLSRINEEGIEAGAAFDTAERGVRSQGALAGKQLKERLSNLGITGSQTEKFFSKLEGKVAQSIGSLAVQETQATLARNRLVNRAKTASQEELTEMLAGVDRSEFAAIVNQLNADRDFELRSDFQQQQIISSQLENQLLSLQLDSFPEKLAAELKGLNQSFELGSLSIEEAKYQIEQLQDPESIYNQLKDFEVRMGEIDITNANLETKQRQKELNRKIAGLAKVYKDPNEALKAEVEMKGLLLELDGLEKSLEDKDTEGASSSDVRSWLTTMTWGELQVAIENDRELLIQYDLLQYANQLLSQKRTNSADR